MRVRWPGNIADVMRTSFLFVVVGTILSFATGTSIGRLAVDSLGVGIVLFGCAGVLGSLIVAAFTDTSAPVADAAVATD